MKKTNERGFSAVEILLFIVLAVLIIGLGVWVYGQRGNDTQQTSSTEAVSEQATENKSQTELITKLDDDAVVTLLNPEDIDELPEDIPESFVSYMKKELAVNNTPVDGCYTGYTVSSYSELNISGGTGPVSPDGESDNDGCYGGAAMFWYYQDGKWDALASQSLISCKKLAKTNIYSEFIEKCFINIAGDTKNNPNGSIVDAIR